MTVTYWEKDPRDTEDFEFDFAASSNGSGTENYLEEEERILSHTITVEGGITAPESSLTKNDTAVRVWLQGGKNNRDYTVTVRVVTTEARVAVRSMTLRVRVQ